MTTCVWTGSNPNENYPEHSHEALRQAYRSGFDEANRRIDNGRTCGSWDQVLAQARVSPKFEQSLPDDGQWEYTITSDCAGSNVTYLRRLPRYEGEHHPWGPSTEAAWQAARPDTQSA